uniref:Uncharacterized protein n=1 Tax=Lepeophtheirus salmonis TaxID=72036 RepID=A0A0K2T984_LEPSM
MVMRVFISCAVYCYITPFD